MAAICSNCHTVFEQPGKYCSERCAREVRKHRLQIVLVSVLGVLVIVFAIYTTLPRSDLRPEPRLPVAASEIQKLAQDDLCPLCNGKGKVDCKTCVDGKIFYLGTSAECSRCDGTGWIVCPVCGGTGKVQDALARAAKE